MGKTGTVRVLMLVICAVILFSIASASSVTISKSTYADRGGYFLRAYYENSNAPVTGCTSPCLTVDTQATEPTGSGSFSVPSGSSAYLWSPQFATATTVSAGDWALDFWAAAGVSSTYVPITLTNSQTSATPSTLQVLIQPNPSTYSAYEASDLGNIRFCTSAACSTKLYSWLEGCGSGAPYGPCSTASTTANFWVKLTSGIAGSGGTLTIYMVFLASSTQFDGVYAGEAPQLSATYGADDNGANVFDLYFNGNTAVSSFNGGTSNTVAQTTDANPISGGSTMNVIDLTGYGASNRVNMIFTTPLPAGNPSYGEIAESYSEIQTGYQPNAQGLAGFCDSTSTGSTTINAESEVVGASGTLYDYVYVADGAATKETGAGVDAALTWYYAALAYPGTGSTSFSGIVSTTFYASYAASLAEHPITGSSQLYWCSVGSSVPGNPDGLYFNWGRARAYPPGGVLPTVSLGGLSSNIASVSIYVTGSSGSTVSTVSSNVQSPALGTTETEYTMAFAGPQVTIPANGYISIVITVLSSTTVYWGAGQPTNFQVDYTYKT